MQTYLEEAKLIGSPRRTNNQGFDVANIGFLTSHCESFSRNEPTFVNGKRGNFADPPTEICSLLDLADLLYYPTTSPVVS